jgi:putative oxidoreductase
MHTFNNAAWAAFILRLSLGFMFMAHGLLKILVFTPSGTARFFESIGLPGPLAYLVMGAEIGGGILLVLGVQTTRVAWALVPVLLGAAWVHLPNGWLFTNPNGGWEYPVFLAVVAVVQGLLGDGVFALGNRIRMLATRSAVQAA